MLATRGVSRLQLDYRAQKTNRPIRVCFALDNLSRAGTEMQLLALIRTLKRNEVQPSLVLLDGMSAESRELEPTDCPVIRLGVKKLLLPSAMKPARRLLNFWSTQKPDILQSYFLDSAYFTAPLACIAGIPKVVRVRNNLGYWLTPKHRLLNRLVAPLIDQTITNSEQGRDALIRIDRLPSGRIAVLENGVDVERYTDTLAPGVHEGPLRLGCVANLRPVKNIDGLIRAVAHVPNVHLQIAGDGPLRSDMERLVLELNLADRVQLLGSVADVPAFLSRIDLAILPSHSEGMSNALLEYMAAGRAVITTDVGANSAVLGDAGVIVPAGSDELLAEAIQKLAKDRPLIRRFGERARFRAIENFSRDAMRSRFELYYRELMKA